MMLQSSKGGGSSSRLLNDKRENMRCEKTKSFNPRSTKVNKKKNGLNKSNDDQVMLRRSDIEREELDQEVEDLEYGNTMVVGVKVIMGGGGSGGGGNKVVMEDHAYHSISSAILDQKKLLAGDIIEEVCVLGGGEDGSHDSHQVVHRMHAPFVGGKSGLQRELRRLHATGYTALLLTVRRNLINCPSRDSSIAMSTSSRPNPPNLRHRRPTFVSDIRVDIVLGDSGMLKKQFALRAPHDPSHVVTFVDTTNEECIALQEARRTQVLSHLANIQLKEVYIPYVSDKKMHQAQSLTKSKMIFSLVVFPFSVDRLLHLYNDVDNTIARALAWLAASQSSGVPIHFLNIQTEPLLTKVSGQRASSRTVSAGSHEEHLNIINTGIYGFEDYHGIDIGVLRAVRLWYVPSVAEVPIVLNPEEDETQLGICISRTNEGFCYVSSVEENSVADRAGLKSFVEAANLEGRLLVISRVAEEKITPTLISSDGAIRSFDTMSISQKLSIHRKAGQAIQIHLMVWDEAMLVSQARGHPRHSYNACDSTTTSTGSSSSSSPNSMQGSNCHLSHTLDNMSRRRNGSLKLANELPHDDHNIKKKTTISSQALDNLVTKGYGNRDESKDLDELDIVKRKDRRSESRESGEFSFRFTHVMSLDEW